MKNEGPVYWHIQMREGKKGTLINSMPMLEEQQPVIGTGEWEDKQKQCEKFKRIPIGSIVLVREGNRALALCKIIGDNYTSEELKAKYGNINYRNERF